MEGADMRIRTAVVAGVLTLAIAGPAVATPHAPTNGGNGAGQSGQCTGPASERPASCQSSK
jgi:hypothetical protein